MNLPDTYEITPYLPLIGWSEKEFKHKDAETVARAFMQAGIRNLNILVMFFFIGLGARKPLRL